MDALSSSSAEIQKLLSIDELIDLDGFRGVDPAAIFGVDFENTPEKQLPLTARTYSNIGMALQGAPLDDWGRYGMYHHNRRPEFSSFDAVTEGLDAEGKRRFCVVLLQYMNDISAREPDFRNRRFEMETLVSAARWVADMLRSANKDSISFVRGIKKWGGDLPQPLIAQPLRVLPPVNPEAPASPIEATTKTLQQRARDLLGKIMKLLP